MNSSEQTRRRRPRLFGLVTYCTLGGTAISWCLGDRMAQRFLTVEKIGSYEEFVIAFFFIGGCFGMLCGFVLERVIQIRPIRWFRKRHDSGERFNRFKKMLRCPICGTRFLTVQIQGHCPACENDFAIYDFPNSEQPIYLRRSVR